MKSIRCCRIGLLGSRAQQKDEGAAACWRDQALISLLCVFLPVLFPKKVSKSFSELCVMLLWFKWNSMVPFIIFLKGLKAQFDA